MPRDLRRLLEHTLEECHADKRKSEGGKPIRRTKGWKDVSEEFGDLGFMLFILSFFISALLISAGTKEPFVEWSTCMKAGCILHWIVLLVVLINVPWRDAMHGISDVAWPAIVASCWMSPEYSSYLYGKERLIAVFDDLFKDSPEISIALHRLSQPLLAYRSRFLIAEIDSALRRLAGRIVVGQDARIPKSGTYVRQLNALREEMSELIRGAGAFGLCDQNDRTPYFSAPIILESDWEEAGLELPAVERVEPKAAAEALTPA